MAINNFHTQFHRRTAWVTVFLLLGFGLISYRLFVLQIINGAEFKKTAQQQHSIYKKLLPSRGEIKLVDKFTLETIPLAINTKKYLAYADPKEIKEIAGTSSQLAKVLSVPEDEIAKKLGQKDRRYVPLKKQLTEQEQEALKALKLPGIYLDAEESRFYPQQNLLSHVLGFVGYQDDKKVGLYGLERNFEEDLAGKTGELKAEKDTSGAWILGTQREMIPAEDGQNLILTIDKNIQFKAESVLKETVIKNEAESGSIIAINPKTGEILAMAGYPDFNPNEYNKVEDARAFLNEAATGSYEPGSVFKPLTMAAAVNENKVTAETTYNDTGFVEIDGYTLRNSDNKANGPQTMTQVLEKSLNTGVIFAKEQIGDGEFYKYIKKFGFGKKTGVELPEAQGNLDNLKADIKVNFHTASFGQGISVTPLQLVQAFTAIANQGKMMKPYIVQSLVTPAGKVKKTEPQVVNQVITSKTANTVSAMMVNVVENGHGKKAGVPGYFIAGKTGTAQVPKKDGRGYEENKNIGSFIGFGPVENPQFLMLVRINYPKTVKFAESTAAPAFGELAGFILNYYHIPPSRN